jgi:hypothetical protein
VTITPEYAATDVVLAYATTIAGAQGRTADRGHVLVTPRTSAQALYVGMTRGRESNIAHVVCDGHDHQELASATAHPATRSPLRCNATPTATCPPTPSPNAGTTNAQPETPLALQTDKSNKPKRSGANSSAPYRHASSTNSPENTSRSFEFWHASTPTADARQQ